MIRHLHSFSMKNKNNNNDGDENLPELPEDLHVAIEEYTDLNNQLLEKNYLMHFENGVDYSELYFLGQEILHLTEARNSVLQRIILMITKLTNERPDNGDTPYGDKKFFRF